MSLSSCDLLDDIYSHQGYTQYRIKIRSQDSLVPTLVTYTGFARLYTVAFLVRMCGASGIKIFLAFAYSYIYDFLCSSPKALLHYRLQSPPYDPGYLSNLRTSLT